MSTQTSAIRKLLARVSILALPAAAMLMAYVIVDPFCVVRAHASYYDHNPVVTNRDWVSTELYERDARVKSYDAIIFGSSRSLAFHCDDWIALGSDLHCFHFDAWAETLFGIWSKVRFIDQQGLPLKRALAIIDESVLPYTADSSGHIFMKHPDVAGTSMFTFQKENLSAFFSNLFVIKYADYRINRRFRHYMEMTLEDHDWQQLAGSNDLIFTAYDAQIASQGEAYWTSRASEFVHVGGTNPPQLLARQREMLSDIAAIFAKNGTEVSIIVPPLYDQRKMAPDDVAALRSIFGGRAVYDASGVNEYTEDFHNYYDASHFRPEVAASVLTRAKRDAAAP